MHAIADDPDMSYQDMTEDLLPFTWYTSANNYYKKLGVKKGCVEWVPCFLTGALKMETMRCA